MKTLILDEIKRDTSFCLKNGINTEDPFCINNLMDKVKEKVDWGIDGIFFCANLIYSFFLVFF